MGGGAEQLYGLARAVEEGRVAHFGAAMLLYQAAATLDYEPAIIRLAYLLDTIGHRGLSRGTETAIIAISNAARVSDVRSMRRYLSYLCCYGDHIVATCRVIGSLLMNLVGKGDSLTLVNVGLGRWDSLIEKLANGPKIFLGIDRVECLKKAAEMGVIGAKTELARVMYEAVEDGEGVDDAVWANWFESVEAGDARVLDCLHDWLWGSWDSAPLDLGEFAVVAQDSALHHGDLVACLWLARGFLEGSPLPRDLVVSCRYFRRLSALGGLVSTDEELPELFGERLCVRSFLHGFFGLGLVGGLATTPSRVENSRVSPWIRLIAINFDLPVVLKALRRCSRLSWRELQVSDQHVTYLSSKSKRFWSLRLSDVAHGCNAAALEARLFALLD